MVRDVPKAVAPVAGQPFLYFLLKQLKQQGFQRLVFSLGYKHELIEEYLWEWKDDFDMAFAIEDEPLGTGGGIRNAVLSAKEKSSFILNADTFFEVNLQDMFQFHQAQNADLTIALKPLTNFNRYGIVMIDEEKNIVGFKEKQPTQSGLINGGIYLLNNRLLTDFTFPEKFSFEKDFLETHLHFHHFKGYVADGYFIDIGVPEDFAKANVDLK